MAVRGLTSTIASYQSGESSTKVASSTNSNGISNSVATNQKNTVRIDMMNEEGQKRESNADANRFKNAIDQVNEKLKFTKTRCEFSYHEEVNRVSIRVLDKETNEIIREIPPEESYKALEKIWEIAGLLVDEKR